jgi:hypothetical protein
LPPCSTGSNGLPEANSARPFDHAYACSAVHSDLDVGFDSANTIGRSLMAHIASITSRVNVPAVAATPMMAVGFSAFTAERKSATGACSWAYGSLCSASPVREATTSPLESTSQQRRRASAGATPSSTIAVTRRSEMPVAASPAPMHRNVCSPSRLPVTRSAE